MSLLSKYGEILNDISGVRAINNDISDQLAFSQKTINLSVGNPDILSEVDKMWKKHIYDLLNSDEYNEVMCKYGASRGYEKFISSIINLMKNMYGVNLTEKNILVTPGSQQLSFYASNIFAGLSERGKKKILFASSPEYTGYSNMGLSKEFLCALKPNIEIVDTHSFKYSVNFDNINFGEIGLVILSRPCNPSGNVIPYKTLGELFSLTKSKNIPVLIDNAYAPPFPNIAFNELKPIFSDNVINVFSFSKAGIAGLRLGVAIGKECFIEPLNSFQSNACIMASTFAQAIVSRSINSGDLQNVCKCVILQHYRQKADFFDNCMKKYVDNEIPYYIHKSEGTFFKWIWFDHLPITDINLYQILKKYNIIIVPGSAFFPGIDELEWDHQRECIRISLTSSYGQLEEAIKILGETLKDIYNEQLSGKFGKED